MHLISMNTEWPSQILCYSSWMLSSSVENPVLTELDSIISQRQSHGLRTPESGMLNCSQKSHNTWDIWLSSQGICVFVSFSSWVGADDTANMRQVTGYRLDTGLRARVATESQLSHITQLSHIKPVTVSHYVTFIVMNKCHNAWVFSGTDVMHYDNFDCNS